MWQQQTKKKVTKHTNPSNMFEKVKSGGGHFGFAFLQSWSKKVVGSSGVAWGQWNKCVLFSVQVLVFKASHKGLFERFRIAKKNHDIANSKCQ